MKLMRIALMAITPLLLFPGCGDRASDSRNQPPAVPLNPSPADGAIDQVLDVQLSWECSDPDGDEISYDLYFGTGSNPPLIDFGLQQNSFNVGRLDRDADYNWKIVAKDGRTQTDGPLWSFATALEQRIRLIGSFESSLYGHLWVSGDYVYLVSYSSLNIIDFSDPAEPVFAASIESEGEGYFYDIAVHGSLAYLAAGRDGFQIYDVSNAYNPAHLGELIWPDSGSAVAVFVRDNYAYVADRYLNNIRIIDVSNPADPDLVSVSDSPHEHEGLSDISVTGDYAFVVIDDRRPQDPNDIGIIDLTDLSNPHTVRVFGTGGGFHTLVTTDNYLFIPDSPSGNLQILEISDPPNPIPISIYPTPPYTAEVFVLDNYAFLAMWDSGVCVVDISEPRLPEFAAGFYMSGRAESIFVEENLIYVLKQLGDIYVLEFSP